MSHSRAAASSIVPRLPASVMQCVTFENLICAVLIARADAGRMLNVAHLSMRKLLFIAESCRIRKRFKF